MSLTPLDSFENRRLELFREAGVHCPRLELFTFQCLEIVKAALPSDLALELFETVERHAGSITPVKGRRTRQF